MSYAHAHFLANVKDEWLQEAWAEVEEDLDAPDRVVVG